MTYRNLYASVTGVTNPISISVNNSHNSSMAQANIETVSHSLIIGDEIDIDLGYATDHGQIFTGYVKEINRTVKENVYSITAYDKMVRAIDFFMASSDPNAPFSRENISAEDLVRAVMQEAGLAGAGAYHYDPTSFVLGNTQPVEVNLVTVYDFCRSIADALTWNLWADETGDIHFENRKPYVMGANDHGQLGWTADSPVGGISITDHSGISQILDMAYVQSEKDLRNRVVVYGLDGIHAEASESSPWLPSGFFKSVVASYSFIDAQDEADKTADYNLLQLHRLQTAINVTLEGNILYAPRSVYSVDVDSFNLDGNWYCYTAQHSWSRSGYTCTLDLRKTIAAEDYVP